MEVAEIEKAYIAAKQPLSLWKQLLNSLQPIDRLPDEILLDICLRFVILADRTSSLYSLDPSFIVHWTHVCSRWRTIQLFGSI